MSRATTKEGSWGNQSEILQVALGGLQGGGGGGGGGGGVGWGEEKKDREEVTRVVDSSAHVSARDGEGDGKKKKKPA